MNNPIASFIGSWIKTLLVLTLTVAGALLAGWGLKLVGKNHGRWESFTMFVPALVIFAVAYAFHHSGRRAVGMYIWSGFLFACGVIVIFLG